MDKATYDRLREKNTKATAAKAAAPTTSGQKSVNIDPAVLAKMKAKSKPILKSTQPKAGGPTPAKTTKSVQIDPAVLAKMKEGKKT